MARSALLTLFLVLALARGAAADGRWLDAPPVQWNTAGAALPTAPPDTLRNEACRTSERAATRPGERALVARGWRLTTYWPSVEVGAALLVPGLAMYDGMCRPLQYNVFVFVEGDRFAGTLSPGLMFSRTDGALGGTSSDPGYGALGEGGIRARYMRYRAGDALCCPTGGTAEVTYRLEGGTVRALTAASAATSLPRAGGLPTWPLIALAGAALALGARRLAHPG